ncbi:hypothetical protein CcaverHIS002_0406270 [Cutaneotrichosporon cavernicola]|uniref:C3H1-type domain-containing protein n=1 Tax=Cutaneotrichosporon cavernicola TaxID=279322 RepID=A0AA48L4J3_9TREE|nr:uncharacterized protein CcaverHIS019_0406300 [Cutaneotrichosporon cavernicola]BEI84023.1 hypothetical protein CcaverHIS002_0406270 [Cutaneotrichosporon cavernicola]BEI91810.1 hypothetical protein CcaverHIS019_0406300 [Cutaneotrichosporon cavernicola]BEI99581.1 hypothetical protein CcaverHIS631_0406240 [Cutaneotrichosporon cavernicola]BEJ07357.1 hypothetical protein CcaverHIS641_0406260 [Cutaneotrichosporon cavernicola]
MTTTQESAPAPHAEVPPTDVAADHSDAIAAGNEDGVATVEGMEAGVAGLALGNVPQPQSELHRACAEGRLEDVRVTLGRGLDALESLDIATGCTPIVLAVTHGHADVVRELLTAGAIVPPPGLTMDPTMLSILYPHAQAMYGVPPPFAMPQFFQPGYYGGPAHFAPRKEGGSPNGHANGAASGGANGNGPNLPPAEVAKTIPCRNFPNCKYGASCMFFHPLHQPGFFPPQGYYEGGFVPYPPGAPFFPGAQEFVPQQQPNGGPAESAPVSADEAVTPSEENGEAGPKHEAAAHIPSAGAAAFVPGMPMPQEMMNGFVGSPPVGFMSPLMPTQDAAAFYATSPPQFQPFLPNGSYPGHGRRQSFNQFNNGGGHALKPYHGKKPSFSGGPKPWGPGGRPGGSSHLGHWKDGNPPPCAFFREGKCRNGEFCKFPHLDTEGNDCRHPDVIRGIIPPMPTRPPRVLNMMHGGRSYPQHQQMLAAKQAQAAANAEAAAAEDGVTTPESGSDKGSASSPGLPPKPPAGSLPPSRAGSQPGHARVGSRAHSPSGRRGGARYANGHTSRSSSSGGDKRPAPPQRIPRADEFPALSLGGSLTPSAERREPSWGKTAAQVLSEPAPTKPEAVKEEGEAEKASDAETAEVEVEAKETVEKTESPVVTMDSDSEPDAVIVLVSTTPTPEAAEAVKAKVAAVSFAAAIETAPVALKA